MIAHHIGPFASGFRLPVYTELSSLFLESYSPKDESSYARNMELTFGTGLLTYGPKWDTTKYKFGPASMTFDPDRGGYFKTPFEGALSMEAGDFTVEFSMMGEVEPQVTANILGAAGSTAFTSYYFNYNHVSNTISFGCRNVASSTILFATFTLGVDGVGIADFWNGKFHHVAAVRTGTTIKLYVDGLLGGGAITIGTDSLKTTSVNPLLIGVAATDTNSVVPLAVSLDEVRFTKGVARYTAPFTPTAVKFGRNATDDPDFASVGLLMGCDSRIALRKGGNVSGALKYALPENTNFLDKNGLKRFTSATNTANGLYFDYDPEFNFGSGNFTVELFGVYNQDIAWQANSPLLGCWHSSTANRGWQIIALGTQFAFQYSVDGTTITTVNFAAGSSMNVAYDLAAVRSGNTLRLYRNGILETTHDMTGISIYDFSASAVPLGVLISLNSALAISEGSHRDTAHLRALRVSKARAFYTESSYVVPALPLAPLPADPPPAAPPPFVSDFDIVMNDFTTPPLGSATDFILGN